MSFDLDEALKYILRKTYKNCCFLSSHLMSNETYLNYDFLPTYIITHVRTHMSNSHTVAVLKPRFLWSLREAPTILLFFFTINPLAVSFVKNKFSVYLLRSFFFTIIHHKTKKLHYAAKNSSITCSMNFLSYFNLFFLL